MTPGRARSSSSAQRIPLPEVAEEGPFANMRDPRVRALVVALLHLQLSIFFRLPIGDVRNSHDLVIRAAAVAAAAGDLGPTAASLLVALERFIRSNDVSPIAWRMLARPARGALRARLPARHKASPDGPFSELDALVLGSEWLARVTGASEASASGLTPEEAASWLEAQNDAGRRYSSRPALDAAPGSARAPVANGPRSPRSGSSCLR